jgi:hypothetical protein
MLRGFIYSIIAVVLFLFASIGWMVLRGPDEDTLYLLSGWLILICFFAVGPLFFALGYWHHLRRTPGDSHWDKEIGE